MNYTADEVMQYAAEEDVKFVRLAFCDIRGRQKNIAILPDELGRAFRYGIAIDASAIAGFGGEVHSDLFLHPDTSTLTFLPWLSEQGKVIRMFCHITYPDGTPFEADTRSILAKAVDCAHEQGVSFAFGSEMEFYLFKLDENGEPTKLPYDNAGYMDIAPEDKGENVRREVCFTLEQMGIKPESAHHEEGPGQNEVDFKHAAPLTAADDVITFKNVVKTVAARNGLYGSFSPKPLADKPGSGMHVNISLARGGRNIFAPGPDGAYSPAMRSFIAGVLARAGEICAFTNPVPGSYARFGSFEAPRYVAWSHQNRSQLIRIPAAPAPEYARIEVRMPDVSCNPYLAFALLLAAGFEGMERKMELAEETPYDLYTANAGAL